MLGLTIDLPKLLLHQLDLYFVFSGVVEEVVAELNTNDEAEEAQEVRPQHCRFVELCQF